MFIKATIQHTGKVKYFNVDQIKTIEPTDHKEARSIIICAVAPNNEWHYVLESPEELIAQTQKRKKI